MENDNDAMCHEEGMHRRIETCPTFTNIHAYMHNHAQRQYLKLQRQQRG